MAVPSTISVWTLPFQDFQVSSWRREGRIRQWHWTTLNSTWAFSATGHCSREWPNKWSPSRKGSSPFSRFHTCPCSTLTSWSSCSVDRETTNGTRRHCPNPATLTMVTTWIQERSSSCLRSFPITIVKNSENFCNLWPDRHDCPLEDSNRCHRHWPLSGKPTTRVTLQTIIFPPWWLVSITSNYLITLRSRSWRWNSNWPPKRDRTASILVRRVPTVLSCSGHRSKMCNRIKYSAKNVVEHNSKKM